MQQHHQTFSLRPSSRDAGWDDECMTNCDVTFLIFPQSAWNTSGNILFSFYFSQRGRLTCGDFKQDSAQHAPSNISAFDCTHSSLQTCVQLGFVLVLPKLLSRESSYSQNSGPGLQMGPQLGQTPLLITFTHEWTQSKNHRIIMKMIQLMLLF